MYASTQEFCYRQSCIYRFKSIDCIFHLHGFSEAFFCMQPHSYSFFYLELKHICISTYRHAYLQSNALIFLEENWKMTVDSASSQRKKKKKIFHFSIVFVFTDTLRFSKSSEFEKSQFWGWEINLNNCTGMWTKVFTEELFQCFWCV